MVPRGNSSWSSLNQLMEFIESAFKDSVKRQISEMPILGRAGRALYHGQAEPEHPYYLAIGICVLTDNWTSIRSFVETEYRNSRGNQRRWEGHRRENRNQILEGQIEPQAKAHGTVKADHSY